MGKLILLISLFLSQPCFGQSARTDEEVNQEALQNTMELLQNREKRDAYIKGDSKAQKADTMARQVVGDGAKLDELYKAAAVIFRDMATANNGDAKSMQEALGAAQKDPKAFYNNLTPEQRQMIKGLAESSAPAPQ
ncbi:MAG: hypothetical protein KDD33_08735 [Bdellovibrionales bacterium]|nr:hypothetical protein [Bdellovibrionales bacterium]